LIFGFKCPARALRLLVMQRVDRIHFGCLRGRIDAEKQAYRSGYGQGGDYREEIHRYGQAADRLDKQAQQDASRVKNERSLLARNEFREMAIDSAKLILLSMVFYFYGNF